MVVGHPILDFRFWIDKRLLLLSPVPNHQSPVTSHLLQLLERAIATNCTDR
ncbi:hypothetical protein PN497_14000 [Sphaerospermopsis kisseleviana CS-549]|uniref:LysR family transcriptional regulator n=1 Tax=Sphaerospermopsis kisseleviana CS-549 TaxID=3021783 RepID=A0ABT4ZSU9_9CYAN|nr:hypothetical protein [Sphaerospermopsis kisseleviana]MDB9442465.1 hypothetical protein [Sphaerospermopsis kisseleviana CS-549]